MKFCTSCGNQIEEDAGFCPHCGKRQPAAATSYTATTRGKRLHCPKCKNNQLSPIVETDVRGSTSVHMPVGGRMGVSDTYTRSTHREYWMCQSCGHKFRQIENLEEELAKGRKALTGTVIIIIPLIIIALLDLFTGGPILHILMIPLILFDGILCVVWKKKVTKLTAEKKYLTRKCFD